jgi:dTMP kinase
VFITLEGGEGVGKTTQQALLVERLRQEGYACLCTREPGGTALGKTLRELLLHGDPFSPLAELLLYAADRAEHVSKVIAPALAAGQVVVCDRFTDSTLAYQGYGRGHGLWSRSASSTDWATGGLQPHLTLWLDLPPRGGAGTRQASRPAGADELAVLQSKLTSKNAWSSTAASTKRIPGPGCRRTPADCPRFGPGIPCRGGCADLVGGEASFS